MPKGADRVIIIGAGHAGVQLADSLRHEGYTGTITLVNDEGRLPYQRPPLSKDYLAVSDLEPEVLPLRGESFYTSADIDLRMGIRATSVDRAARTVVLADGTELGYSQLVFATGASNRMLHVPGRNLNGVFAMRTLEDAQRIRTRVDGMSHAVVIGAGFIGLEFAAGAAKRGINVTVVEMADGPMQRVLSPAMSAYFAEALGGVGVTVRYNEGVSEIQGKGGEVTGVLLASGEILPAGIVIAGIGAVPNDQLAAACDLLTEGGVLVDETLQTADAAVFAIGDCARYPSAHVGARARLESVQNATDHARHLATRLAGGAVAPYTEVPWFWSIQGSLRLSIVGIASPHLDPIVRGEQDSGKFSIYSFRDGELACVESVNAPGDHISARRMLAAGHLPTRAQVSDPSFDLKAFSKLPALSAPR